MSLPIKKIVELGSKIPILFLLVAVLAGGYFLGSAVDGTSAPPAAHGEHAAEADSAAEIWTCSMHPQIKLPEPGSCPLCGMDLILADAKPAPKATKKPRYACSMFCVPPMEKPGKCPICGMVMVEVEEEGGGELAGVEGPTLTLSPAARKLAEVEVALVERKFVEADIRLVGKIEYDETRVGTITAWVGGRIDRLFVDYTGVPVRQGDHMVYLYSPDLSNAQAELLNSIQSVQDLANSEITSLREAAHRDVEASRDRLRLMGLTDKQIEEVERRGTPSDHMTIYAPMGGIVIHKNAVEGMYVKTGTRIYTISDLSHLWVKLDAYESDLVWLRYGQQVDFATEAYPGETFGGQIAFIDPVLDDKTRTVKVRVHVSNEDGRLKPGMFVRAVVRSQVAAGGRVMDPSMAGKWICPMHPEVIKDDSGDCDTCGMALVEAESMGYVSVDESSKDVPLVIPVSAPLRTGTRAVVYVAVPDQEGVFEGRIVTLGARAGDYYIVKEGLQEGERVVVNGNFKIDSAMQIQSKPSMMSPQGGSSTGAHDHD